MSDPAAAPSPRMSATQWLIVIIAAIGFAFDIYELLMLPLILRPALMELGGIQPGTPEFQTWFALMFYVPALAGGIFGLLGGYITDLLGRRRVLTWSILLYAFSAFAAGFATDLKTLLFLRCTTFIGVCVEFVAAVAWLAELFPNPTQRERVLGWTQAFSSVGGLLVALANAMAVAWSAGKAAPLFFGLELPALQLPEIHLPGFLLGISDDIQNPTAPWRYTLMSGLIPAIPLIIIRPFLPESPAWAEKKAQGTLKRASIGQLFSPELRKVTLVTAAMFACSYGAAFGAIQMMPQIAPGLPDVKADVVDKTSAPEVKARVAAATSAKPLLKSLEGKTEDERRKALAAAAGKVVGPIRGSTEQAAAAELTKSQEIGGLVGRFALAMLVVQIASRRMLLRVFQLPGLFLVPAIFVGAGLIIDGKVDAGGKQYLTIGMFVAGFFTVAQFSFWGNYLPRVYPLHLRGTGESFAANIGGRLIGTSFAAVNGLVAGMAFVPGDSPPAKVAYTAAGLALLVYAVGSVLCFLLPEPPPELDEEAESQSEKSKVQSSK